jgi:hypothetical protein
MNRQLGAAVTALPGIALAMWVSWASGNSEVVARIAQISPWMATHVMWIGLAATLTIAGSIAYAIYSDEAQGGFGIEARGEASARVILAIATVVFVGMLIISVGYVAGLGWFAAKSAFSW